MKQFFDSFDDYKKKIYTEKRTAVHFEDVYFFPRMNTYRIKSQLALAMGILNYRCAAELSQ